MKICIISDSHDEIYLLEAAVVAAKAAGVEAVLHCGDVVEPSTLQCLIKHGVPVHFVHGNNTGDLCTVSTIVEQSDGLLHYYGQDASLMLGGRRIFLIHYPHLAESAAVSSGDDWDLVCCGHYHVVNQKKLVNMRGYTTYFINPGTVGGRGAPATYMIGDLEHMEFSLRFLDKADITT